MAPAAVAIWSSIASRGFVKRMRRWLVEPTTELVTTTTALAPTANLGSIPKKRVRIGTRNTPPPNPSIEPRMAATAATAPISSE